MPCQAGPVLLRSTCLTYYALDGRDGYVLSCYVLSYAAVRCACAAASGGLVIMKCHALICSAVCCACAAAQCDLARYVVLLYADA